jgi:hypothetical protein
MAREQFHRFYPNEQGYVVRPAAPTTTTVP